MKQIRGALKWHRWETFPMVFKEGSTGGDPVSWFPRTEGGHSLALLLTSPSLCLSQTNSRHKEPRLRMVSRDYVKEGRYCLLRYRGSVKGGEGRRGSPSWCSFSLAKNFKLVQLLPKLQPWGYRQVSSSSTRCFHFVYVTHHLDQRRSVDTG